MLWLLIGTAIPFVAGVALAFTLRLRNRTEDVLAAALLTFTQIVVTLLFCGVVLHSLARSTVLVVNLAMTVVVVGVCVPQGRLRTGAREARDRWSHGWGARPTVEPLRRIWAWITGVSAAVIAAYLALVAYVVPVYAYDAIWYHLSAVAAWIGTDRIGISPLEPVLNFFPMNGELSFLWTGVLTGGDTWIDLPQVIFAVLGAIAVLAIARLLSISRPGAIVAASLWFLTPIVLMQSTANYVDLILPALFLAGMAFLLRFLEDVHAGRTTTFVAVPALAGCGIGLAAGTKTTGLLYAAVAFVVLVGNLLVVRRRGVSGRQILAATFAFLLPVLALGSFWYVRSWVEYGNPVEPLTLEIAGHQVLTGLPKYAGEGVDGLDRQMPQEIRDQPALLRPIYSWLHDPTAYDYQQRIGGFGRQWLWLELPALLVFTGWTLVRRRRWFTNLILPFLVMFTLTPANWWSRLTVVVVAPGAIALVWCIERIRTKALVVVLQVVTLAVVGTNAVFVLRSLGSRALDITPAKVVRMLGQSRLDRTTAVFAAPEYRWADHLPRGSGVAVVPADVPARLYYLLVGPDFSNRVIAIPRSRTDDPAALAQRLRDAGADYLFTTTGTPEQVAADADPACFAPVASPGAERVYRFDCRSTG
jgi:hypothetical protein